MQAFYRSLTAPRLKRQGFVAFKTPAKSILYIYFYKSLCYRAFLSLVMHGSFSFFIFHNIKKNIDDQFGSMAPFVHQYIHDFFSTNLHSPLLNASVDTELSILNSSQHHKPQDLLLEQLSELLLFYGCKSENPIKALGAFLEFLGLGFLYQSKPLADTGPLALQHEPNIESFSTNFFLYHTLLIEQQQSSRLMAWAFLVAMLFDYPLKNLFALLDKKNIHSHFSLHQHFIDWVQSINIQVQPIFAQPLVDPTVFFQQIPAKTMLWDRSSIQKLGPHLDFNEQLILFLLYNSSMGTRAQLPLICPHLHSFFYLDDPSRQSINQL